MLLQGNRDVSIVPLLSLLYQKKIESHLET